MVTLSNEQRRIVEAPPTGGHRLVLAAPGSGKTHTIIERIRHLTVAHGVEPRHVLVLTFTRHAAAELRHRLKSPDIWAGTFHALCAEMLTDHGAVIGWGPPVRIYDEGQLRTALERAAATAGVAVNAADERACQRFYGELKTRISRRKRRGLDNDAARAGDRIPDDIVVAVDAAYHHHLAEVRALDYDDLIIRGNELLRSDEETVTLLQRRVRYVFVDEFHDISPEQYELIRHLAPPHWPRPNQVQRSNPDPEETEDQAHQVLVVADPDQAIYGWRGANATMMLRQFRTDYRPGTYKLTRNYRSHGAIVAVADQLIGGERRSAATTSQAEPGLPVDCIGLSRVELEAQLLARMIERARATGKYDYGDIAVLYRTHARADAAEAALLRHGMPIWRVRPGRFFSQPDVQEALRYLELIEALHDDDFEPALNWPRVLVDELTMIRLRRLSAEAGMTLGTFARRVDEFADWVTPLTRVAIQAFLATIDAGLVPIVERPIGEIVPRLLELLAARQCPIPRAERETLLGVIDFIGRSLGAAVDHLHEAVAAGRPIVVHHAGDGDSLAAAVILEHLLTTYLNHSVTLVAEAPGPPGDHFSILLGREQPAAPDGFGLDVLRTRTLQYSIATRVWRLGQLLLMRYERQETERIVIFDLETGSVDPNHAEIVEIAAVAYGTEREEFFHSLVRPTGPGAISFGASEQSGIAWRDVHDAPTPATIMPEVVRFLDDAIVAGHNIESFDYPILQRVARVAEVPLPPHPLLDTFKLARRLLPDAPSHRLIDLGRALDSRATQQHRALSDVRLNGKVLRHLLDLQRRHQELDTLLEALPLVGLSITAARLPARDENATLIQIGARATSFGQGHSLRQRWQTLANVNNAHNDGQSTAWFNQPKAEVVEEDATWERLATGWRDATAAFCSVSDEQGLRAFLAYAKLAQPIDFLPTHALAPDDDPERAAAINRIAMMTAHSAKGKEWPLVFIIGAEDDEFPLWRSADLDEERRLLYVAMTRARQRLCILWVSETKGRTRQVSRFLHALPPEVLHRRP